MTAQNLVESGRKATFRVNVKENVARALLDALSTQCKSYCILSGYDSLPDDLEAGIDYMVSHEDFDRMPRILQEVARKTGTHLFQAIDHELTGRAYFLGSLEGSSLTIVQPDCAADYRHFGRRWLSAGEVLGARRLHPNGFYIPSTAHEFAYSLIKHLNVRSFTRDDGYRLHRLYVEDRIECGRMIARFCPGPEGSSIVRMASANDWTSMFASPESYRSAMLGSRKEPFSQRVQDVPKKALYGVKGMLRPAGCSIAVLGQDSYQKSLILNAVNRAFAPSFRSVRYCCVMPGAAGREIVSRRHAPDPRRQLPLGRFAATARTIGVWFGYILRYVTHVLPGIVGTQLVLLDGCLYDLVAGTNAVRYPAPSWLLSAAARLSPRPSLVIALDPILETPRLRRSEVQENVRQRSVSQVVTHNIPSAVVINAAQPPEGVIHDAIEAIVGHLARRTAKHMGLRA